MLIRWQMGPFDNGPAWEALELSVLLMQRLEPEAEYHVVHQGDIHRHIDGVVWHYQPRPDPYCSGRHQPERLASIDNHEVYMDNDHIIWSLPMGWLRWRERGGVLIWRNNWAYYGNYSDDIHDLRLGYEICPGMWGVGPGLTMPAPIYRVPELGGEYNQDEYGWSALWLAQQEPKWFIDEGTEVRCYCPDHNALGKNRDQRGTHGVHLNGLNRGWNEAGLELLRQLRGELL